METVLEWAVFEDSSILMVAKRHWPQISGATRIIRTERPQVAVPIWTDKIWVRNGVPAGPVFDQEEIELHRVYHIPPATSDVVAVGYGPRSDTLALRMMQPERSA